MKPTYDELMYLVFFLAHRIDMLEKFDDLLLRVREKEVIAFCTENRLMEYDNNA